jgi:primosomal protein N'
MIFKIYLKKIEETLQNKKQILILFPEVFSIQIWQANYHQTQKLIFHNHDSL